MTRIIIYKDFDLIGGGFSGAGGTDKQVKALADANGGDRLNLCPDITSYFDAPCSTLAPLPLAP